MQIILESKCKRKMCVSEGSLWYALYITCNAGRYFFNTVYPFEGTDTSVYYGLYCRVLEFARCTVISDSLAGHAMLSDYPIG